MMTLDIRINGRPLRRVKITNITELPSDINTYHWVCTHPDGFRLVGQVKHNGKNGAMALISTVVQAISKHEIEHEQ